MGSAVMYSYIYFLVEFDNKEQYLTAQAAVQLTAVVSRVLSALVAGTWIWITLLWDMIDRTLLVCLVSPYSMLVPLSTQTSS